MAKNKTILSRLTTEIKDALNTHKRGQIPAPIIIDEYRKVEFAMETADDDSVGGELKRNKFGFGLQVHEYLKDEPYSYTDDEEEREEGWLVGKEDTAESIAKQICLDFGISASDID